MWWESDMQQKVLSFLGDLLVNFPGQLFHRIQSPVHPFCAFIKAHTLQAQLEQLVFIRREVAHGLEVVSLRKS